MAKTFYPLFAGVKLHLPLPYLFVALPLLVINDRSLSICIYNQPPIGFLGSGGQYHMSRVKPIKCLLNPAYYIEKRTLTEE